MKVSNGLREIIEMALISHEMSGHIKPYVKCEYCEGLREDIIESINLEAKIEAVK